MKCGVKLMSNYGCVSGVALAAVLLLAGSPCCLADEMSPAEQAFSDSMKNATLVGFFTVGGREEQPLKPERYEIDSAVKASGKLWIFTVRIKYGNLDTKLPVTVPLEWAGDTPMVALTDAAIPGLGAGFSARVLFDGNQYAGTWKHGAVGGHMFGRIERAAEESAANKEDSK